MKSYLYNLLREPLASHIESLDDAEATHIHRDIILRKPVLYKIYCDKYTEFKNFLEQNQQNGVILEIGSGSGLSKLFLPEILSSEITFFPWIDAVFNATELPFSNDSISCIFVDGVFHHLTHPKKFLEEAFRCLKIGGHIYMIEPQPTLLSRLVFKYIHHEPFDENSGWELRFNSQKNRLTEANLALPWIIFIRDKSLFETSFPWFKFSKQHGSKPFQYLMSGGLSYRQLWPTKLWWVIKFFEWTLRPLYQFISFDMIITLKKIQSNKHD